MNATDAFALRRDDLRAKLLQARDLAQAADEAAMTLEQIACDLAQAEPDDAARQRQQAAFALAKRTPQCLHVARAQGHVTLSPGEVPARSVVRKGLLLSGGVVLAVVAVNDLLVGRGMAALVMLVGAVLLALGASGLMAQPQPQASATATLHADVDALLHEVEAICRTADICTSDLTLLWQEQGIGRVSGTAEEATLDLLCALMEAKLSGRADVAARSLALAEQQLHMLGIEAVVYDDAHAALFDVLPTLGQSRTVRPALVQDGRVLRRGVAAQNAAQEGGLA